MTRKRTVESPDIEAHIDTRLDVQINRALNRLDQIFWLLIAIFAASLMLMFTIVWAFG